MAACGTDSTGLTGNPAPEELAIAGKACSTNVDCATSGGQVVFHCSTPYYGQARCQGVFPPGDQVVPGNAPSCVYYECPAGYQCETEVETHSVICLVGQNNQTGMPTSGQDGAWTTPLTRIGLAAGRGHLDRPNPYAMVAVPFSAGYGFFLRKNLVFLRRYCPRSGGCGATARSHP